MLKKYFTYSHFTLLVALCISTIAAYYSVIGLTAIFSGAVGPIIVMGGILELSKIVTTVWLHRYWSRAGYAIRTYLTIAVVALACLTSMGIFGLLSKAHSEQGVISGDSQAKVAIYDEKIKVSKENIDANRKALKQMDEAVDQTMGRSSDENGANKAVQIRRSQQKERTRLLTDIEAEQKKISQLMEDRAPLAAQSRKIEAEVGPIKYIAALIYGDNPDANLLERAVRWVIILIVAVFDPLAIILILAANNSMRWDREDAEAKYEQDDGPLTAKQLDDIKELAEEELPTGTIIEKDSLFDKLTVTSEEEEAFKELEPKLSDPELDPCYKCGTPLMNAPGIGPFCPNKECDVVDNTEGVEWEVVKPEPPKSLLESHPYLMKPFNHFTNTTPIVHKPESKFVMDAEVLDVCNDERLVSKNDKASKPKRTRKPKVASVEPVEPAEPVAAEDFVTDGVTTEAQLFHPSQRYVTYDGKSMSIDALKSMRPDLILKKSDPINQILFGSKFPEFARLGDIYIRTDAIPHRVLKFNGRKWIDIDKTQNTSYLQYIPYLNYLVEKIGSGEYDTEMLTEAEQEELAQHLGKK